MRQACPLIDDGETDCIRRAFDFERHRRLAVAVGVFQQVGEVAARAAKPAANSALNPDGQVRKAVYPN